VRPACGDEGVKAVVLCAVQSHEFDQVGGNRQGKRRGSRRGLGISRVQGSSSFTFHGVLQEDAIKLTWAATKPDAGGHAILGKCSWDKDSRSKTLGAVVRRYEKGLCSDHIADHSAFL